MIYKWGELAALGTAICWTVTSLSFESAGKKVGSLSVNFIRLVIGLFFLCLTTLLIRGYFLPLDASTHAWIWLSISGLVGFAIGDLLLFEAFVIVGARVSMLIMSLVPPITAIIGFLFLHEKMTMLELLGMFLTVGGVALVILERAPGQKKINFTHPISGLLCGVGGALGQSVGLILSKYGMGSYNAFAATQIRVIAGIVGFALIFALLKKWRNINIAVKNPRAMVGISLGSIFGPFLGVALSLLAIQYTKTGIASTIMAIVPLLIIPPAVIVFHEKVTLKEIIGAIIAVVGVTIFFLPAQILQQI